MKRQCKRGLSVTFFKSLEFLFILSLILDLCLYAMDEDRGREIRKGGRNDPRLYSIPSNMKPSYEHERRGGAQSSQARPEGQRISIKRKHDSEKSPSGKLAATVSELKRMKICEEKGKEKIERDRDNETITTVSSAASIKTSASIEVLQSEPQPVLKQNEKRRPNHQQPFKKATGSKSAKEHVQKTGADAKYKDPQIGHGQSWQNHGPIADVLEKNLAVIGQASNLHMNKADRLYPEGYKDGNGFFVEHGTVNARYSIQCLVDNKSGKVVSPVCIIDTQAREFSREAKDKYHKRVERAFNQERMKDIQSLHDTRTQSFPTWNEMQNKVHKRIQKDKREGKFTGLAVYKFDEQSRGYRNPKEEFLKEQGLENPVEAAKEDFLRQEFMTEEGGESSANPQLTDDSEG